MAQRARLTYHQATFDLLAIAPAVAPDADARLDACEAKLGSKLPASLREVYSLEVALETLRALHRGVTPYGLDELRRAGAYDERDSWDRELPRTLAPERRYAVLPRSGSGERDQRNYDTDPLLQIMAEDHGSCRWAVPLEDVADDPEVLVEDVDSDVWRLAAGHYSTFVYAAAWDLGLAVNHGKWSGPAPSAEGLGALREHFREGPPTFGWPGDWQLRFSDDDGRIRINKLIDCNWVDWWIDARSRAALEALTRRLATLAGPPERLEDWEFLGG